MALFLKPQKTGNEATDKLIMELMLIIEKLWAEIAKKQNKED